MRVRQDEKTRGAYGRACERVATTMALHHLDNALLRVPAEALAMRCREHKASVLSEVVEAAAAIEVLGRGEVADERAAVAALANQLRGIKRKMDQGHSFFAHPPISPICRTPLFPYLTF